MEPIKLTQNVRLRPVSDWQSVTAVGEQYTGYWIPLVKLNFPTVRKTKPIEYRLYWYGILSLAKAFSVYVFNIY